MIHYIHECSPEYRYSSNIYIYILLVISYNRRENSERAEKKILLFLLTIFWGVYSGYIIENRIEGERKSIYIY